jgi:hypothetical protein
MNNDLAKASEAANHLPSVLRWSIADAWAWFLHGWRVFIHLPYLGIVGLVLVAVVVLRGLAKVLR